MQCSSMNCEPHLLIFKRSFNSETYNTSYYIVARSYRLHIYEETDKKLTLKWTSNIQTNCDRNFKVFSFCFLKKIFKFPRNKKIRTFNCLKLKYSRHVTTRRNSVKLETIYLLELGRNSRLDKSLTFESLFYNLS